MYRISFLSVFFVADNDAELDSILARLRGMDLRYRVKRM